MAQYRVIFTDGAWMDINLPPEATLPALVTTSRSMGYFLSDQMYISFDMIRCILGWSGDKPPDVPIPNSPTTMTKQ